MSMRRSHDMNRITGTHRVNFASWSRSRKRSRRPRSPSASRLRACWVTQAPFGWAVTPARWTRRVSSSTKHRMVVGQETAVEAAKWRRARQRRFNPRQRVTWIQERRPACPRPRTLPQCPRTSPGLNPPLVVRTFPWAALLTRRIATDDGPAARRSGVDGMAFGAACHKRGRCAAYSNSRMTRYDGDSMRSEWCLVVFARSGPL
jgi:hypothetical protein